MQLTPLQYNVLLHYSGARFVHPVMLRAEQYWLHDNGYLAYHVDKHPDVWQLTIKGRAVLYKVRKSLE